MVQREGSSVTKSPEQVSLTARGDVHDTKAMSGVGGMGKTKTKINEK